MGALIEADRLKLFIIAAIALALIPAWYLLAVLSTDQWYYSVQAMVNIGRKPLAESLNLRIPKSVAEEREMWGLVNWVVKYPYREDIAKSLEPYRLESPKKDSGDTSPGRESDGRATGASVGTPTSKAPEPDAAATQNSDERHSSSEQGKDDEIGGEQPTTSDSDADAYRVEEDGP
jgi:hypothetical protein